MNATRRFLLFPPLVVALLGITACRTTPEAAAGPSVRTEAPQQVRDLLKKWNGKWIMYARQDAAFRTFHDLDGSVIFIAFIEINDERNPKEDPQSAMNRVVGDAYDFMKAGGIKMAVHVQNNSEVYFKQLLEKPRAVAMISRRYAAFSQSETQKLVRIEFQ